MAKLNALNEATLTKLESMAPAKTEFEHKLSPENRTKLEKNARTLKAVQAEIVEFASTLPPDREHWLLERFALHQALTMNIAHIGVIADDNKRYIKAESVAASRGARTKTLAEQLPKIVDALKSIVAESPSTTFTLGSKGKPGKMSVEQVQEKIFVEGVFEPSKKQIADAIKKMKA